MRAHINKHLNKNTTLWALGLSPLVWSVHFLFSYVVGAIDCAKKLGSGSELAFTRSSVLLLTIVSVLILGREILLSFHKHKINNSPPPHDAPTPLDRERFLGLARLLISSLGLIAILYTAYVVWFFRSCR